MVQMLGKLDRGSTDDPAHDAIANSHDNHRRTGKPAANLRTSLMFSGEDASTFHR